MIGSIERALNAAGHSLPSDFYSLSSKQQIEVLHPTPDKYRGLEVAFYRSIWHQTTTDNNARQYCKHLWAVVANMYSARPYNNLDRISEVLSLTDRLHVNLSSPSILTLFLEDIGTTKHIDLRQTSSNYAAMALEKCGLSSPKIKVITNLITSSSFIPPSVLAHYEYKLTYDLRNLRFALPWEKLKENHALSLKEFEDMGVDNILQGQRNIIKHKIRLIERDKKFFSLYLFEKEYRNLVEDNLERLLGFITEFIRENNGSSFAYYQDD